MYCGTLHQLDDGSIVPSSANLKSIYLFQLIKPLVSILRRINIGYYQLRSPVSRQVTVAHISLAQLVSLWPQLQISPLGTNNIGTRYSVILRDIRESVMTIFAPNSSHTLLYSCTCQSSNSGWLCPHILGVLVFQVEVELSNSAEESHTELALDQAQPQNANQEVPEYVSIAFSRSRRLVFDKGFFQLSN